jgi:hypothetical protein
MRFFGDFSANDNVCVLLKRIYEPASSALSRNVSSREDTVCRAVSFSREGEAPAEPSRNLGELKRLGRSLALPRIDVSTDTASTAGVRANA